MYWISFEWGWKWKIRGELGRVANSRKFPFPATPKDSAAQNLVGGLRIDRPPDSVGSCQFGCFGEGGSLQEPRLRAHLLRNKSCSVSSTCIVVLNFTFVGVRPVTDATVSHPAIANSSADPEANAGML